MPEPENVAEGVERQRNIFAVVTAGIVGFVLLVFIFQNTDSVEVQWLFLSLSMPLWVLIVLVLVLGATLGWIVRWLMRRRKRG
ncbi:MAG: lipopolysaccharide assembly protein LapA domain-containing protein [Actinomycetota bacterium]|nr:lipopolysaccharide assembly protein LapA domain-containing protein [Actinomycetota bacterium]